MTLFLRAFILTVPRFFIIMVSLIALQYLDVSPLPAWTVVLIAYLAHFVLTWLFAVWAFRKRAPTQVQIGIVAAIFVVIGTIWESGLYYYLTPRATWQGLLSNYQWGSLIIVAIYLVAVWLAGWRAQRKNRATLPEGILV